jgi:hypothetical protein
LAALSQRDLERAAEVADMLDTGMVWTGPTAQWPICRLAGPAFRCRPGAGPEGINEFVKSS